MEKGFVEFDRNNLKITVHLEEGDVVITKDDVDLSYFSGGPGGQNVNRNLNGVQLAYAIPEEHRRNATRTRQLITRSINQRSKDQNMKKAFEQLVKKMEHYFYVPPTRHKTKVPKKAKERRLRDKKIKGRKKQARKKTSDEI